MVKMFLLSALLSFWLVSQRQVADWLTLCVYAHASNLFADSMKSFHLTPDCIYKKKNVTFCFPAIPTTFIQQLKNMQAEEGSNVLLRCELSKPGIPVEWRKGHEQLKNGVKYQIRKRETTLELLIWKPAPEDSGVYSCVCADQMTSATVKITGRT